MKTRLLLLILVFAIVPTVLYVAFSEAEARKQGVLLNAIRDKGLIIARTLAPALAVDDRPLVEFQAELNRYATDDTRIKLLLKPHAVGEDQPGFHYVAAQVAAMAAVMVVETAAEMAVAAPLPAMAKAMAMARACVFQRLGQRLGQCVGQRLGWQ